MAEHNSGWLTAVIIMIIIVLINPPNTNTQLIKTNNMNSYGNVRQNLN